MINIDATKSTPRVFFSENEKRLSISGMSYPENSHEFFSPVFRWLEAALPRYDEFEFHVAISYMNSSSTKYMLDIFDLLNAAAEQGCRVSVTWEYEEGNERALDLAEEFKEDVAMPFEIVSVKG